MSRAGITTLRALPGEAMRVVRHVTTKVTTGNVNLTEGSARESAALSYRRLRRKITSTLFAAGKTTKTSAAALAMDAGSELKSQVEDEIIQDFQPQTVKASQTGATFVVEYGYFPSVPPLFAILKPTVETASVVVTA
jgi:HPt (histidine-containing phosphotransfer) domain-containing protein